MNNKISISEIIFGLFVSLLVIYMTLTFEPKKDKINEFYQVYLGGQKIGLINSKDDLYNLIDKEQEGIKKKYNVDKVYPPEGLEVEKILTYKTNLKTSEQIYDEINDIDPFTIEGYEVTVKKGDKKTKFYIIHKEDLDEAVKNTVLSFVKEDEYNNYLNGVEKDSNEEGRSITDIYFESDLSIKKTYISTEENIITDKDTLKMYFLFGTTNLTGTYKVKASDTIESIAYNNKLGVEDFLVANPDIKGENALLAVGQEVTIAAINPVSNIIVESFETEMQEVEYDTEIQYDNKLSVEETYVKQEGSNGLSKVVYATKESNGVILDSQMASEDVITEPTKKIVVAGAKGVYYVGNSTYWVWPTSKPYRISSCYSYRNHPIRGQYHFHAALDITGTKSKNIYAIQSGTVISAFNDNGYHQGAGNNIKIEHANNYVSQYMHLAKSLVKVGDHVEKGQLIGIMGRTGSATGVHLDFRVFKNGNNINPFSIYYKTAYPCYGK